MPKIFFRTADSKAFTKEIESEVNYDKALESIVKAFRIPKQNIRLVYNEEVKTSNFSLNPEIPHHIILIVGKSKIANEEIDVWLKLNAGPASRNIGNFKTKSNTQVKDFLSHIFEENGIGKEKINVAEVFYWGVKLNS